MLTFISSVSECSLRVSESHTCWNEWFRARASVYTDGMDSSRFSRIISGNGN